MKQILLVLVAGATLFNRKQFHLLDISFFRNTVATFSRI